jgi:peptide-methionine (S)-S-oxide reductase
MPRLRRNGLAALAGLALGLFALAAPAPAQMAQVPELKPGEAVAIFAGGCFWCVESDFDHVTGVTSTISGYIGGKVEKPTYEQVSRDDTGHREAVRITFDPAKVTFAKLLDVFWHSVDPTDPNGQFCDQGHSYTTAIYATSGAQRMLAQFSKDAIERTGALPKPIVTEIVTAPTFWPAEEYHQDYYKKNPVRYRFYRWNCGRDARLKELWGEAAMRGIEKTKEE